MKNTVYSTYTDISVVIGVLFKTLLPYLSLEPWPFGLITKGPFSLGLMGLNETQQVKKLT